MLFLLLLPMIVAPTIYEQEDFGSESLEEFTYSISVDCTAGTIKLIVGDEDNKPVEDANTYLKYIDFAQPLISSGETDKEGKVVHKLPGNVKLMRGFFIMVIQKTDYKSKEIHFDISRCHANETIEETVEPEEEPPEIEPPAAPPPPPPEEPPEEENATALPFNITPEMPEIITETNETIEEGARGCPIAFLFPLLLICGMLCALKDAAS